MNDLRFKKSKKRKIKNQIVSLIIALLSITMVMFGILSKSNSILFVFLGLFIIEIYLIIKSVHTVDSIIVNINGISTRINGMGLIEWKYIEDFEIKNGINTMVLLVKINNTEKLLRAVSKESRKSMLKNIRKFGSPVVIPQTELHDSINHVKRRLLSYRNTLFPNRSYLVNLL